MSETTNTITSEVLADLEQRVEAAHKIYSAAFHAREDREKELSAVAAQRAALVRELKKAQGALPKVTTAAIETALIDPGRVDPTPAFAARSRARFLKQALAFAAAYPYSDAEREVIEARISELNSQLILEQLRAEFQELKVVRAVGAIDAQSGGLTLDGFGATAEAMRHNIEHILKTLRDLREQLRTHDAATLDARRAYEQEHRQNV